MYKKFFKRLLDIVFATSALVLLSPLLLVLTIVGAVKMKGNPFFTQPRPGKYEKIFKLIKFRTMTNQRDQTGNLLPDEMRLNSYGKFLRKTSLDELPELFNILMGKMSIIGPRPLLVQYLPLYSEEQHRRHDVRPGLTGLAQIKGRNAISWEQKFEYDIEYIENITFVGDISILYKTALTVIRREGISAEGEATMAAFKGTQERINKEK